MTPKLFRSVFFVSALTASVFANTTVIAKGGHTSSNSGGASNNNGSGNSSSGTATGRRIHKPIKVITPVDSNKSVMSLKKLPGKKKPPTITHETGKFSD